MDILVRKKKGGKWEKVSEKRFENEAALQTILYQSPEIIPFEQLGLSKPIIFVKEAGLPGSGNTDLIGVDEKGGITIIECKLAVNREVRRQVIGQVLEYAAYLWRMEYKHFDELCGKAEKWTDNHLADIVRERIGDIVEGWSESDLIDSLTSTLDKGDFPLIIAVDTLNDELKRIIQFLNSRGEGTPKIHAVEISKFETPELEMLVPASFGVVPPPPPPPPKWDEESFFTQVRNGEKKTADTVIRLYEFAKTRSDQREKMWGTGETASFFFRKVRDDKLVSVFTFNSAGSGSISFGDMVKKGVKEQILRDFTAKLNEISGIDIPEEFISPNRYPTIRAEALIDKASLKKFEDAVLALCQQIES